MFCGVSFIKFCIVFSGLWFIIFWFVLFLLYFCFGGFILEMIDLIEKEIEFCIVNVVFCFFCV